ncbi:tyrosine-type recombinase/integrase [Skermania sp. ID1734]|uniref:tyrosine-type recombinase/integrase n=1 Tax=Skermania sp. ID1734 TaxID=2597516 RepID=UPI00117BF21F|nr:tyrosine-type recombinase/integrase [Skermania sp. ID1734]
MLRNKVPGTPHCLRHFYGTHLVECGADLRVVQELMRHQSSQTTSIYTLVSDTRRRTAIDQLMTLESARFDVANTGAAAFDRFAAGDHFTTEPGPLPLVESATAFRTGYSCGRFDARSTPFATFQTP